MVKSCENPRRIFFYGEPREKKWSHGPRRLQNTHNSQRIVVCTPHQPLALRHDQISGNSKNQSDTSSVTSYGANFFEIGTNRMRHLRSDPVLGYS